MSEYTELLKKLKTQQESDYRMLEGMLEYVLSDNSSNDQTYETLYKEIAKYFIDNYNDSWMYFSEAFSDVKSILGVLLALKHGITDDGEVTFFWKSATCESGYITCKTPHVLFEYSLDLVDSGIITESDIIPYSEFVQVLKKHKKDLLYEELLSKIWCFEIECGYQDV